MELLDFRREHILQAMGIAMENYQEERAAVPALPAVASLPDLAPFALNGLGCAAFERGKMVGFLCCFPPRENAFTGTARGAFSPIHAHGALREGRGRIYQRLYQAAAAKWAEKGISSHSVGLYAHDRAAIEAFFQYGFGLRCVDAIRPMAPIGAPDCKGFTFWEVAKADRERLDPLHRMLEEHFVQSPVFMKHIGPDRWKEECTRLFAAADQRGIAAYVEIADTAENFATEQVGVQNICGAFCLPEHRGKGLYQTLLNFLIETLAAEGYTRLGVDYESFNPTAARFWQKYFTPYTHGVVRRIDENALAGLTE
ncbi:MAG: GNAT family N-acetyltransferase [Oscillospiraceae bacterium]|nr:GNAT family N-acetyltransferase [Oscillospiraceae bacterium]